MKTIAAQRKKGLVRIAELILRVGLAVIALELISIVFRLSMMEAYDLARLGTYIYSMLEHILMALTLTVGGALLFDIAYRKAERDSQED